MVRQEGEHEGLGSLDIYQPLCPASPAARIRTHIQNIFTGQIISLSDQAVTPPLPWARKETVGEENTS